MPVVPSRRHPWRRRAATMAGATLAAAALVSCSSGSEAAPAVPGTSAAAEAPSPGGPGSAPSSPASSASSDTAPSVLQVTEADFTIDMAQREIPAGRYTVEVANEGRATHDLVVEDPDGEDVAASGTIAPGTSGTVEVTLEPGEYVFYCSVGNHRGMGMELVVTVVP